MAEEGFSVDLMDRETARFTAEMQRHQQSITAKASVGAELVERAGFGGTVARRGGGEGI
jgi:hypothetical protein